MLERRTCFVFMSGGSSYLFDSQLSSQEKQLARLARSRADADSGRTLVVQLLLLALSVLLSKLHGSTTLNLGIMALMLLFMM